ncbi:MAG: PAS domain S-box protein [Desulfococcaceae bacterium]
MMKLSHEVLLALAYVSQISDPDSVRSRFIESLNGLDEGFAFEFADRLPDGIPECRIMPIATLRSSFGYAVIAESPEISETGLAVFRSAFKFLAVILENRMQARTLESKNRSLLKEIKTEKSLVRTVLDTLPVGVWVADGNGRILMGNAANEKIWAGPSYIGKARWSGTGKNIEPDDWGISRAIRAGETVTDQEIYIECCDGKHKTILHSAAPLLNDEQCVIGAVGINQNITERKQAENALHESERILKATQRLAKTGGWEWDVVMQTIKWTDETYRIHDLDPAQFGPGSSAHIDKSRDCYAPEDQSVIMEAFRRCIEQGEPYDLEFPFTTAKGRKLWIRTTAEAVRADGRVVRVAGNIMDITERRHAEEKVIQSRDLLANLARMVPGVIYQYRLYPDGRSAFPYASPGIIDIYEVTPEEAREDATPVYDRLHPDDRDRVVEAIMESGRTLQTFYCELRVVLPRQGLRWLWSQAHPERLADGSTLWHGIISDITERVQAQDALREKEEFQRTLIAASPLAIISYTADGSVLSWSTAAERIFGWQEKEVLGRFIPIVPKDQYDGFANLRKSVTEGGTFSQIELTQQCRDGSLIGVSLSMSPIRDKENRVSAIMAVLEDITDRRKAEEEKNKLQAQLIQAQKMESVGRLAGGVAHDYNNMLSVILGYTEMALEKLTPEDRLRPDLEEIKAAARRSADITRQLLAFSRQQTIAPRVLSLNETVESMLRMLRRLIGENIDLSWYPGACLWPVYMDPIQLDQILVNLCVNARDAISDVGKISIETGIKTFDQAYCADHADFMPGDFVLLSVSDDGCGMDRATLDKIFEPFFTTKEIGRGTGLGLATVYGIVRQNSGFINVYSEPGQGTIFRIYLPRHKAAAEQVQKKDSAAPADALGSETILLVEDEHTILKMTAMMTERLGYKVLTAGTPDEAIGLAGGHSGRINLLITDVVMPDMNGRDLSERIKSISPGIKVLFMSGYTANVIAHRGILDKTVNFIHKPFSKQDLAAKIRDVLDKTE